MVASDCEVCDDVKCKRLLLRVAWSSNLKGLSSDAKELRSLCVLNSSSETYVGEWSLGCLFINFKNKITILLSSDQWAMNFIG